ncbi:MAG: nicotinate-nucleotide adenylyltransferase [bacterium]|nr:nicotinate-nucleotide adenylyltransferase [bacterium]
MRGRGRAVGILGGSFDPVHIGHLIIAREVLERLGLDEVLLVPCNVPPHKRPAAAAAAAHRLRMVELAVRGDPCLAACDMEIRRGGVSYSIDTVDALKRRRGPAASLHFIIGADSLLDLATWKEYARLVTACEIVTAARPGCDLRGWPPPAAAIPPAAAAAIRARILPTPLIDISSTDIRRRRREGRGIRYLVPAAVERYIVREGLYAGRGTEGR